MLSRRRGGGEADKMYKFEVSCGQKTRSRVRAPERHMLLINLRPI
jgi:hypothetical protein